MNPSEIIAAQKALESKAQAIFWRIFDVRPDWQKRLLYRPSIDSVSFDKTEISIRGMARACGRGCCGYESSTYSFPVSLIDLDYDGVTEWIGAAEAARQAEARIVQARIETLEATLAEKRSVADNICERIRFLEGKAKFEGADTAVEIAALTEALEVANDAVNTIEFELSIAKSETED